MSKNFCQVNLLHYKMRRKFTVQFFLHQIPSFQLSQRKESNSRGGRNNEGLNRWNIFQDKIYVIKYFKSSHKLFTQSNQKIKTEERRQ